eukprot:GILJ01001118.1.p4 GENE.GILJ01001118.1~~GILJ01001118.1.p4  ORF type:complete len:102 (-),score=21.08 GILJ01001118.1:682-987(-)
MNKVEQFLAEHAVVVFSKTSCGYCANVKALLERLRVPFFACELNTLEDGSEIQDALARKTGQRTVPNVFIGGNHVGGCDDTNAAHRSGKLKELLSAVGIAI